MQLERWNEYLYTLTKAHKRRFTPEWNHDETTNLKLILTKEKNEKTGRRQDTGASNELNLVWNQCGQASNDKNLNDLWYYFKRLFELEFNIFYTIPVSVEFGLPNIIETIDTAETKKNTSLYVFEQNKDHFAICT